VDIKEQKYGAVLVVRPEGPLKGDDAEAFKNRMTRALGESLGRCVVDASAIKFIDSKGLEALVEVNETVSQTGCLLKLCGANDTVREVLDLTQLASLFEQYDDLNSAVRSFL
jgi:anti-sigma B factor antagonist